MYDYVEFVKTDFIPMGLINMHKSHVYAEGFVTSSTESYLMILHVVSKNINSVELSMLLYTNNISQLVYYYEQLQ